MSLMREIREFAVPRGGVAFWWLGQNGFIFKTHEGTVTGTDLYLTDSCVRIAPEGIDLSRQVPVLIPPEELDVDLFVCTHNHQDHTDPETIERLRHKDTMSFVGPHPSCGVFARLGVESGRIVPVWPDHVVELRDVRIRGAFAMPTDDTDLNHLGYVFEFGAAPPIYMTGDTADCELLESARRHAPELMITCINGGFKNLSHFEAAGLASRVKPRVAIPCHYDMFPDNSIDPRQFRAALKLRAPDIGYLAPAHGEGVVFSG
jgi:L-ascorbate 6-phosphate lactonase